MEKHFQKVAKNVFSWEKPKDFLMLLGDSRNYMPPIFVPSSAKRIATQILVITKLNGRKYFILRVFICDIIRHSKELPAQS